MTLPIHSSITSFFAQTVNETLKSSPSALIVATVPVFGVLSYIAYSTFQSESLSKRDMQKVITVKRRDLDETIQISLEGKETDLTISDFLNLLDENSNDLRTRRNLLDTTTVTLKNDPDKNSYRIENICGHPKITIYFNLIRR